LSDTPDQTNQSLVAELAALRHEIDLLNNHRFVRAHDSWLGLVGYNFVRGLAMGLGTVVGATLLVSVAVYFLSQIDFIPIIGDWANLIVGEITRDQMEPAR